MLAFPVTMMKTSAAGYDADAQAFFTAVAGVGGTIGSTAKQAYSDFIANGKANGWWSHMLWIMPFIGDFTAACCAHAISLGALQPTIDNFVSGDYAENLGLIGDGSTKKIRHLVVPPAPTGGRSMYVRVAAVSGNRLMGVADSGTDRYEMRRASSTVTDTYGGTTQSGQTPSRFIGHFHSRRNSSTSLQLWHDGALVGTTATATTALSISPLASFGYCFNNNGSAASFCTATFRQCFTHYDDGTMTSGQMDAFGAAVIALQTALGRNV